jgi:hypothetical protein
MLIITEHLISLTYNLEQLCSSILRCSTFHFLYAYYVGTTVCIMSSELYTPYHYQTHGDVVYTTDET